jgi:FkbM family methyltransferase
MSVQPVNDCSLDTNSPSLDEHSPSWSTVFEKWRKWPYYAQALTRLVLSLRNPWNLLSVAAGRSATLTFRSGFKLQVITPLDLLVAAEVILLDCYGLSSIRPPARVLDVGGALGEFGLFVNHLFPEAHVTIFEPNPASFAILEGNAKLNGCSNVTLRWGCVGPNPSYPFPVSHSAENSLIENAGRLVDVPGVTLWDSLDQEVDVLKVDTEGFEIPVLETAGERLRQIRHIWLEYHEHLVPGQVARLTELLNERGYAVRVRPDPFDGRIGLVFASRETR